ncbi:MAG TPA: hypothetical protein VLT36_09145 [Candidatus Dormibacteraeota bacterium]|nr:hypothetical protein [Candidatus Dormibacteraeota bacterium]
MPSPVPIASNVRNAFSKPHRRGKFARLPATVRDQVNRMLRDGFSYTKILETLQSNPETATLALSKQNLSNWKNGGHQEWLTRQEWRDDLCERQAELLQDPQKSNFQEVSLQVASMRIFELLQRLETSTLSANLQDLSPAFLRLLAVLPRITREALRYQKYREACLQARAQLEPLRDPKRELDDDERRAIVRRVDKILGFTLRDESPVTNHTPEPQRNTSH